MINADKINEHLRSGGVVQVTTYLRSTIYYPKHAGWFTEGKDGGIYVKHGRGKNYLGKPNALLVSIQFGRIV